MVPEGHAQLWGAGLAFGLSGDYGPAVAILVPQLEHLVRIMLKSRSVHTLFVDDHGVETEKSLSALLEVPEAAGLFEPARPVPCGTKSGMSVEPRTTRPTLDDIAARAGVSQSTASRVVTGRVKVGAAARAAVLEAIRELGYVPNLAARMLVTPQPELVAVVVPQTAERLRSDPYFGEVLLGISNELTERNLQLAFVPADTLSSAGRLQGYLMRHRLDGVILMDVAEPTLALLLDEARIPAVTLGRLLDDFPLPSVDVDNRAGAASAVRHLLERGRVVVGTITGRLTTVSAVERLAGYKDALREAGQPVRAELIVEGDYGEHLGYEGTRTLLGRVPDIDGVFTGSDWAAAGALRALSESRRAVPDDVGVVGFDDIPLASHTRPTLTTVRQPIEEIGRSLARTLCAVLAGHAVDSVVLPTELVVRQSS